MNEKALVESTKLEIAQKVREACMSAAESGFRDAKMSGLCTDGAVEAAVGAMQSLDLRKVINHME